MRRASCVLIIVILPAWFAGQSAWDPAFFHAAQQNPIPQKEYRLKVSVDLVMVDAIVRDKQGAAIEGLRADDFLVYDNGVAQTVTYFSHDRLPLAVALLIDRSPSIGRYLPELCKVGIAALEKLKAEDQVVLYSFDECPAQLTELTENRDEVAAAIGGITIGRSTNIYGAVFESARFLREKAPDRRRAIILISDNESTIFPMSEQDMLTAVLESSATLFSIRAPGDSTFPSGNPDSIERTAKQSGGEVLKLGNTEKLSAALERAIANLRMGYTVGFVPARSGDDRTFHKLTVKLNPATRCPGCRVQARTGYYAGSHTRSSGGILMGVRVPPFNCAQYFAESVATQRMWVAAEAESEYRQIALAGGTETNEDARGKPQIKVALKIGPAGLTFRTIADRHVGRVDVAVFYGDSKGKYLGEEWQTADLQLQDEAYGQALQSGIDVSVTIPFKAQGQIIKVVVCDVWSGRLASRLLRMR